MLDEWGLGGLGRIHQSIHVARQATTGGLGLQSALCVAHSLELDVLRWRRQEAFAMRFEPGVADYAHEVHRVTAALRHYLAGLLTEAGDVVQLGADPALDDVEAALTSAVEQTHLPAGSPPGGLRSHPVRGVRRRADPRTAGRMLRYAAHVVQQLQFSTLTFGPTGGPS